MINWIKRFRSLGKIFVISCGKIMKCIFVILIISLGLLNVCKSEDEVTELSNSEASTDSEKVIKPKATPDNGSEFNLKS